MGHILLILILLISAFLRFYRLPELMMFIGDQGWFYLSARDLIIKGDVPLVGITSSHTWLHQGAIWTYMLAPALWFFNFNPVSGAYLTSMLGVATVWLIYKVGKEMFSERLGLIASLLYATSPYIIIHARMAYHTSPIPLFVVLFIFFSYKWLKGNVSYFPVLLFITGILYNLELASVVYWFVLLVFLAWGFRRRASWIKHIFQKKIIVLSFITFVVSMLPIIVYDIQNGFTQTVKFGIWIGYKIAIGLYQLLLGSTSAPETDMIVDFLNIYISRMFFLDNVVIAYIIILISLAWLYFYMYGFHIKKELKIEYIILFLTTTIPLLGFIINRTVSEAYLPLLYPQLFIAIGLFFTWLTKTNMRFISILLLIGIIGNNVSMLMQKEYLMGKNGYGPKFLDRISVAKTIVSEANGRDYNLIARGDGSEFKSFTMNYEYLTWWLHHPPSKQKAKIVFTIEEKKGKIYLNRND